ncbi:MAG: alpha/beta fold hydrolase [Pseudomonadota bacterium]|nr:alpha/beta fold hydrolase [Pseudomonadota bacterium]
MAEQLHVKTSGEGDSNVVLLHGLFGSAKNLGQIARGLKGEYRVHSVDLPDHGRSDWLPQASIQDYAHCVAAWMDDHQLTNCCVIGHSLGGKVAMQLAVNRPELIQRLVILDISPKAYNVRRHDHIFAGLNAVKAAGVKTRAAAREVLLAHIEEPSVADFLLTSAYKDESGLIDWRFNLAQLEVDYRHMLSSIEVQEARGLPCQIPSLVVRGAASNYVPKTTKQDFAHLFGALNVVTVKNAGHWLHQEQTEIVLSLIGRFIAP